MKILVAFFVFFVGINLQAQALDAECLEDSIQAQAEVVLQFDSIPPLKIYDPNLIKNKVSKIATLNALQPKKNNVFWITLGISILLSVLLLNSLELVQSTLKTFLNLSTALQFSRTEKSSNTYYYLIYLFFFIVMLLFILTNAGVAINFKGFNFFKLFALVIAYALFDYLISYQYLLFTKNNKIVDTIQVVMLSYAVLLCMAVWPALYLVLLSNPAVSNFMYYALFVIIFSVLVLREIRIIQILWIEKVDVLSFHFFAYLCTFKILPIIIIAKSIIT